jgi:hypothetical protein
MTSQKTDMKQPNVRANAPWPWPNRKAPMTMLSTAQAGPTMSAIFIDLRAPRPAAGNGGPLRVAPFLFTGTTPLLLSSVHIKPNAVPALPTYGGRSGQMNSMAAEAGK